MKRFILGIALAAAALATTHTTHVAHAQMAAALGKPLPSPDLAAGTVSVRVVAGSLSKAVIGTEVTLVVDGAPRIARTGDDGRALFKDIPSGAKVQAKVTSDGKEIASETFPVTGGVKVMLSTEDWKDSGGGGGAPMAGAGAQGMPNPRQMSGEPRPEGNDLPGTFTARLSYDDFADKTPPTDVPVALVGYHSNDLIDLQIANTDKEGRAQFTRLDRTGSVSYFAMALLPRGDKMDRLFSKPALLDARQGVRVILSGEKRDSAAPPADDLAKFEDQDDSTAQGKVRVTLEGGVDMNATVTLVEITTAQPTQPGTVANARRVFASGKPRPGPPNLKDIFAEADFKQRPDLPAGTVEVRVHGGVNQTDNPLEGVGIMIATPDTYEQRKLLVDAKTGPDGKGSVTIDPNTKGPYIVTVTINGKPLTSKPFELQGGGGEFEVVAHWSSEGKPQVEFDLVPRPGQVFVAETVMHGVLFRSLPFQPVPDRGTRVSIFIVPRIQFSFSLTSRVDDKYLGVNGRFSIANQAWAPYRGGADGTTIPLPRGFTGGFLAEKDQGDVAVMPGNGFRVIRPLPPGKKTFHGGFSLPVDDGTVRWALDLPFGTDGSGMEIMRPPGMTVDTPAGVKGETVQVPGQGEFFVLPQISIMPGQSMVMTVRGLPQPPAWKLWAARIFGIIVILMMLTGLAVALLRRRAQTDRDARRQALLDELVELEQAGKTNKNAKRREQLMAELEPLWRDDDAA